jgi:hypothetical protein
VAAGQPPAGVGGGGGGVGGRRSLVGRGGLEVGMTIQLPEHIGSPTSGYPVMHAGLNKFLIFSFYEDLYKTYIVYWGFIQIL